MTQQLSSKEGGSWTKITRLWSHDCRENGASLSTTGRHSYL